MKDFKSKIVDVAKYVTSEAQKGATVIAKKGKEQIDRISLESELAKMQKELGIIVYDMKKAGKEDDERIEKYVNMIDAVQTELLNLKMGSDSNGEVIEIQNFEEN